MRFAKRVSSTDEVGTRDPLAHLSPFSHPPRYQPSLPVILRRVLGHESSKFLDVSVLRIRDPLDLFSILPFHNRRDAVDSILCSIDVLRISPSEVE